MLVLDCPGAGDFRLQACCQTCGSRASHETSGSPEPRSDLRQDPFKWKDGLEHLAEGLEDTSLKHLVSQPQINQQCNCIAFGVLGKS